MEHKILNKEKLSESQLRKDAMTILEAGLAAIDTRQVIKNTISLESDALCIKDTMCSLASTKRVIFIGVGKCASEAAVAFEELLGDRLVGGVVLDVAISNTCKTQKIECFTGTHPLPTDQNVFVTKKIVEKLKGLSEDDLVLIFVSGGGSTLLCLPEEGATCVDESLILQALFKKGATIQEINTIRKHISLARGGHLARYAYPAQVISLIVSDVPGNDISFVASGPTVKDETTVVDASAILEKYGLSQFMGPAFQLIETPKDDMYFKKVWNILFISNEHALRAMTSEALTLGYDAEIRDSKVAGEARVVGDKILSELRATQGKKALLYGGETTVTISGHGKGGRNQELSLSLLSKIQQDELVISLASDGRDNSDAAGGICDMVTHEHAKQHDIDPATYLADNDSFTFFQKTGDDIQTGHTGSNVSDLILALKL